MEELGIEISVINEEGNRGHAAGEVDMSHLRSYKDSIFRIPGLFKMCNEQAYTPYKFSIGPWHFGETQLLRTGQKLKESFLQGLIDRFPDPETKKQELEMAIGSVYVKARECYDGGDVYVEGKNRDVTEDEFLKILLLDGCFIIELFCKTAESSVAQITEPSFAQITELRVAQIAEPFVTQITEPLLPGHSQAQLFTGGMIQVIYHDLLLLENQIPWFVLQLLFDKTLYHLNFRHNFRTLVELASLFFRPVISCYNRQELPSLQSSHDKNAHLVDFVWRFWVVSSVPEREVRGYEFGVLDCRTLIPSATRLKEAGVKLQKANRSEISDVRFNKDKGVLEIPLLQITPWTETLFRNFVIFEQYIFDSPRVTSYAILLDCLVDTADDVDLLSRAGILDNKLNPEETANFFNRVRDNTLIREFFHADLCKEVNSYCKRRWPRWRASLIHNYFTKPWAIVSVVFATIVLFFTIMQVFYK